MSQDSFETKMSCSGWCERCRAFHGLPFGKSVEFAREVMAEFVSKQRLDYDISPESADPALDFKVILPGNRGHMFGVLECLNRSGETVWLKAFSSLGTGVRDVAGWSPYLVDTETFKREVLPGQKEIKNLTAELKCLGDGDCQRLALEDQRREISRDLMIKVHDLYRFRNFRGETQPLRKVFEKGEKIPGGVGDCCGPKLLHEAIARGLRPISMAEFYWGGTNKSGRKQPGQFFEACAEKCQPILGFILCGNESFHDN